MPGAARTAAPTWPPSRCVAPMPANAAYFPLPADQMLRSRSLTNPIKGAERLLEGPDRAHHRFRRRAPPRRLGADAGGLRFAGRGSRRPARRSRLRLRRHGAAPPAVEGGDERGRTKAPEAARAGEQLGRASRSRSPPTRSSAAAGSRPRWRRRCRRWRPRRAARRRRCRAAARAAPTASRRDRRRQRSRAATPAIANADAGCADQRRDRMLERARDRQRRRPPARASSRAASRPARRRPATRCRRGSGSASAPARARTRSTAASRICCSAIEAAQREVVDRELGVQRQPDASRDRPAMACAAARLDATASRTRPQTSASYDDVDRQQEVADGAAGRRRLRAGVRRRRSRRSTG